jgi:hypothetical protein
MDGLAGVWQGLRRIDVLTLVNDHFNIHQTSTKQQSLDDLNSSCPMGPEVHVVETTKRRRDNFGRGRFSKMCIAQHKVTIETFAIKKLDKKQALDLAKPQHPVS